MEDHELLRAWRRSLQLTQEKLGNMVGRTSRTIAHWESGDHEIPNEKIAKTLGLSFEQYKSGPADVFSKPVQKPEPLEDITANKKNYGIIPEIMIPIYCLSKISRSFQNTPFEGFMHPTILLPNTKDFCSLIVDRPISAAKIPDRLIVNQNPHENEEAEYFLVWDGDKADIVHRKKWKKDMKFLGSILL